jgi:hypothetical protein
MEYSDIADDRRGGKYAKRAARFADKAKTRLNNLPIN